MEPIPNALIKDLLSTGYFFEELKNYSESKEMDLPLYSRGYAVPYLAKISETYERSGQTDKSKILKFAIKHLSNVADTELADAILGLKKVAVSEMSANEKTLSQLAPLDKSERICCRRKSESAQWLAKLLVSMIRMFKLAEITLKRDKSQEPSNSVGDAILSNWDLTGLPSG